MGRTFVFGEEKNKMGSRSYHETATREVRKQARLQADCSIRGTAVLAIKNNAT